jgi:hypothetical protein
VGGSVFPVTILPFFVGVSVLAAARFRLNIFFTQDQYAPLKGNYMQTNLELVEKGSDGMVRGRCTFFQGLKQNSIWLHECTD